MILMISLQAVCPHILLLTCQLRRWMISRAWLRFHLAVRRDGTTVSIFGLVVPYNYFVVVVIVRSVHGYTRQLSGPSRGRHGSERREMVRITKSNGERQMQEWTVISSGNSKLVLPKVVCGRRAT